MPAPPSPFEFAPRTRLVFGAGARRRLGELARELGARRVLVVTDAGLVASGHVADAEAALVAAGCELLRFADTRENPSTADVEACLARARDFRPELLVGLGGGSAIDVAKGANLLLTNGGRMQDYRGPATPGRTPHPLLPLLAVPTTAGTGTEVQSFALIADADTHEKMACGATDGAPRVAVLDPELTLTLPRFVTACTGLDALGHALESAVTRARSAASDLFARAAWERLAPAFPRVLAEPGDLAARGDMLLGAAWAGLAIEHSMLGAAHSMANPLTTRFDIAHGLAVALSLPHVVRFNAEEPGARAVYAALAASAGWEGARDERAAVEALLAGLASFLAAAGVAPALGEYGVRAEHLALLAEEAARQWTARFNPRPVGEPEFRTLFAAALREGV